MTIDSKGFTTYGMDERILTNPGITLSREAVKVQKETVERVKEDLIESQKEEARKAAERQSDLKAGDETGGSANDPGKDLSKDANQFHHVSIEA